MKVLTIEEIATNDVDIQLKTLFEKRTVDDKVTIGTVIIPPKKRVPVKGISSHNENEYSIIIKGTVLIESAGESFRVSAGQATYIPSGEQHWAYNDENEDCEVIYVLVG